MAAAARGILVAVLQGMRLCPLPLIIRPAAIGAAVRAGAHEAQQLLVHICQAGEDKRVKL